ncbi:efflux RND transporter periplasmic adaptor subunit [Pseudomonas sp. Fl5BN2]|uniref:efflux RND transporter periplasmic adaptor subunit n=1 Tax=Pseudomonas sp. Fl5BN2 TaxID=2697652 RepID=UPI001378C764|nr:efflux RND transporter periplasmic adaptor subunit [Pseudomonas sp. Fl5BN2]NBF02275.1 efflux RND transporter periplasmic adaptor subunit [Pseudomonas sp. Fl5BN2]
MLPVGGTKPSTLRIRLMLIAALLILGGLAWGLWHATRPSAQAYAQTPVKVAVANASLQPFTRYLEAIGELEAVQQVSVPAEIGGRIVALPVQSGQRVERGQVLVQLNDGPQRGNLLRLQGEMENAKVRLERSRRLVSVNATSKEAFDDAQTELSTAKGALQALTAQIEQRTIRAPFSGTLGIRKVHLGQYVNPGDILINLVGDKGLYVNFSVAEQALPQVRPGAVLEVVLDALPEQRLSAVVSSLDPFLDRTRTLSVQARLQDAPAAALPRMFARVRLAQPMPSDTLSVPETAVTYNAYGEELFVVQPAEDGQGAPTVRRVSVKTGERRDGRVVIDSGLAPGQQVVISGQIKLSDGSAIEPQQHSVLTPPNTADATVAVGETP